ncbi:BRO family, N-terminal domain [Paramuricea clavata]|uniref:BRO family, N-terminal domain n=1 Tax=Paramuricea clavata TaxID=317549 RepID=A0A6S7I1D5_PARCT|nr:BRO family, N-terminal domain [Paramuricea clavata]
MEKLFKNRELNASVRIVKSGEDVLFYARDVAESLGYADPKKAVQKLVRKQNKASVYELCKGGDSPPFEKCHPQTILLFEPGLYQLICSSRLPIAEDFQDWVFREVLPSIRKTGSYNLPDRRSLKYNQMILINETDLHYAVVSYIRDNYPEAVIIPGLGEYQDTVSKRCDAWKKGYRSGQPDLIIENPKGKYRGFAIEFKSPKGTGVLSERQQLWLVRLRSMGYDTLVSDDIVKTCIRINEYFGIADTDVVGTSSLRKPRKVATKNPICSVKTYRPRFSSGKY